jgi:hypothetical protein
VTHPYPKARHFLVASTLALCLLVVPAGARAEAECNNDALLKAAPFQDAVKGNNCGLIEALRDAHRSNCDAGLLHADCRCVTDKLSAAAERCAKLTGRAASTAGSTALPAPAAPARDCAVEHRMCMGGETGARAICLKDQIIPGIVARCHSQYKQGAAACDLKRSQCQLSAPAAMGAAPQEAHAVSQQAARDKVSEGTAKIRPDLSRFNDVTFESAPSKATVVPLSARRDVDDLVDDDVLATDEAATAAASSRCAPDQQWVIFSCRIRVPEERGVCEMLGANGKGMDCQGAIGCCLAPHEQWTVMKTSERCPIRRCPAVSLPSTAGCTVTPPGTAQDVCALDTRPWPSLSHCMARPRCTSTCQAPTLSGLWTAAQCAQLVSNITTCTTTVNRVHDVEKAQRKTDERDGRLLSCPHDCQQHKFFGQTAAQFEQLGVVVDQLIGEELRTKGNCKPELEQTRIDLLGASRELRTWWEEPIRDRPDELPYGPYWTWFEELSSALRVCQDLAQLETCRQKSRPSTKPPGT